MEIATSLYILALAFTLVVWYFQQLKLSANLPPGPKRKLLIGNLFDIPKKNLWLTLTEWKKDYGEIVYLQALGTKIVVLNTLESVNALLDKKGTIYSSRPRLVMAGEIVGCGRTLPLLQYGTEWRNQRKLLRLALNSEAVKKYTPYQRDISRKYLLSLVERPRDFVPRLKLAVTQIVMAIAYGLAIESQENEYVSDAETMVTFVEQSTVPGTYMVDLIPALKYIPNIFGLVPFQTIGSKYRKIFDRMQTAPFEHVKRELASGSALPSFTADLLTREDVELEDIEEKETHIKVAAATLYGAGGETTYITILTFILAMALFPEKQEKAQEEIDRVIGPERLPDIEDQPSLPYVNALINEVIRWHPVTPLGLARISAQDDYYKGYLIPAGSIMMPNAWAISHDESKHFSPEEFIPERFLLDTGDGPVDPRAYIYGYGRRICPGRFVADSSVYFLITSILSTFRVCKPLDTEGNEVPLSGASGGSGILNCPEPFECRFIPRSAKALELIRG